MSIQSINPATGELIETFEPYTEAQIDEALDQARHAYLRRRDQSFAERAAGMRRVAAYLREHTRPADALFVWGHYTPIYTLSGRLPGTRYPNCSLHMGHFDPLQVGSDFDPARYRSMPDVRATLADLESRRPAIVVDTAPADIHGWSKVPLAAFPELRSYIADHYEEVARPGGVVAMAKG